MNEMKRTKMIVSSGLPATPRRYGDETIHVVTPLDAIVMLERAEREGQIDMIVLAGAYAGDSELARFLGAFYPAVRIEQEAP